MCITLPWATRPSTAAVTLSKLSLLRSLGLPSTPQIKDKKKDKKKSVRVEIRCLHDWMPRMRRTTRVAPEQKRAGSLGVKKLDLTHSRPHAHTGHAMRREKMLSSFNKLAVCTILGSRGESAAAIGRQRSHGVPGECEQHSIPDAARLRRGKRTFDERSYCRASHAACFRSCITA